ncbi:MAG: alpha/beta hydrolase [Acidimicrobiia bacterium]|nr:alpha/beta hydrolase [Acidimicrobiia bacterium]
MRLRNAVALTVGGWLAWRVLGPDLTPRFPHLQTNPLPIPGRTLFVGQHEMFVREAGDAGAPVLVLVHGWNLDGTMTFHRVVPSLAERYRVIVPDLRNHGKSDWVRGRVEVTDLADDLAGLLDAMDVSGATVLGYSMGGMVVQELAQRHPRHVGAMVLAATAAQPIPRVRPAARVAFWLGRSGLRLSNREVARVTGELLYRSAAIRPQHRLWMHQALLKRDPDLYYEIGAAVWRFDSRPWVGRLPQRTLIIIPTEDQVVPPESQYELANLMPDAELIEVSGGYHESILNRPGEYVAAISGFVG